MATLVMGGAFFSMSESASAVTLAGGLTPLPGVTWNGLPASSFEAPSLNNFYTQLAPYVDQQAYELPTLFSGEAPAGSILDYLMFVEITAYEGQNELQLCQNGGGCNTVFAPSDAPGSTDQSALSPSNDYLFKLITGNGTQFYSNASLNPDSLTHFVAFKVTQAGEIDVTPTNISGVPVSVHLSLQVGDLLIGAEDLPGLIGAGSDRDYNDIFFQARSTNAVPEPMTLTLLGLGALGAVRVRSKKNAA